jgi:hypothetical protein
MLAAMIKQGSHSIGDVFFAGVNHGKVLFGLVHPARLSPRIEGVAVSLPEPILFGASVHAPV